MTAKKRELLIGCGSRRQKRVFQGNDSEWSNLTTLDINPDQNPDVLWDLTQTPYPFEDNTFDEIHAYEVLEHIGQQGDYKLFFAQFSELWRILKPNGYLIGTCPALGSRWVWGDPSHSRVISPESLIFLYQDAYGKTDTPMTDFRYLYKADFKPVVLREKDETFQFAIQAVKPSRYTELYNK